MKLTEQEKEHLRQIIQDNHWDSVVKVASVALRNLEIRLLNVGLSEGPREIYARKAQYDGAKQVETMFATLKDQLRKEKKQDEES